MTGRERRDDPAAEETGRAGDEDPQARAFRAARASAKRSPSAASTPRCGFQPRARSRAASPHRRGTSTGRSFSGSSRQHTARPDRAIRRSSSSPIERSTPLARLKISPGCGSSASRASAVTASSMCTKSRRAERLPTARSGSAPNSIAASWAAKEGSAKLCRLPGADQIEGAHDRGAGGEHQPLGGGLGHGIGRSRRNLAALGDRLLFVRNEAIDLGARHEEERTAAGSGQDVFDSENVDREVVRDPAPRLTDVGERREMHDAVGGESRDDLAQCAGIADIDREPVGRSRQFVLVDRHRPHPVPSPLEPSHQPSPHEAGGAGDQDAQRHESGLRQRRFLERQPGATSARCAGASS